jgi:two-component system NarL family sensor kinase
MQLELREQNEINKEKTAQLDAATRSLQAEIANRIRAEASLRELSGRLMQVQDEERRRIARDLHDTTGQVLAALNMNLAEMQHNASPKNSAKFIECTDLVSSAALEIRNLSYLLHPPLMEAMGLSSAVADYAEGFQLRSGLQIEVDVSKDVGRLAGDREIVLFRIIQEGLANIHRHSGSSIAKIRIFREQQAVILEISDQGQGLRRSEDGSIKYGVGLRSMEERVRLSGGSFSIGSNDRGTTVTAVLSEAPAVESY